MKDNTTWRIDTEDHHAGVSVFVGKLWDTKKPYIEVDATDGACNYGGCEPVQMTWQEAEQLAHAILEAVAELKKEPQ